MTLYSTVQKAKLIISAGMILLIASCAATPSPEPDNGKSSSRAPATSKPYTVLGKRYHPLKSARGFSQKGLASWYGKKFHGRRTSNGEVYDMYKVSAAHKTLPMDTWVRVHNLDNGKRLDVRINDRGPFVRGRIIDLSYKAAQLLGVAKPGTARVKIEALGKASVASGGSHEVAYTPIDYWKGNFTVQVGAFTVKSNAENQRTKYSRYGNAHITEFRDDTNLFYRVRVGKFDNLNDAEEFRKRMLRAGEANAFTVAE
ncbi:RlpA-like lipoprotein [Desulfamplus magnetovallimortis]|uniref:Probable endolytic peptidoglycan transglycosylase RlpA n=1 Tax=Desulfamplus magnetovallimortis TaxID=1246637 RepID=A0A1W1HJS8_9BACT|nr:septal ring lytic transglycosylase RlpA family protein [Desulfamplus magnetovallimortis]SLM32632.1 RlpA-like lipoprotein [Desulfamplus magnetovallimortis]